MPQRREQPIDTSAGAGIGRRGSSRPVAGSTAGTADGLWAQAAGSGAAAGARRQLAVGAPTCSARANRGQRVTSKGSLAMWAMMSLVACTAGAAAQQA